ncbi:MAG: hypothetical protein LBV43_09505 [Prevotella sp.]|jgi:hypothetical protein|nr:hypothetical protein [Prevotella sp.]
MKQILLFICIYLSFLLTPGLYAQEVAQTDQTGSADGTYVFSKAALVTFNYETKQEMENFTITDPALIDSTNFHLQRVFLQATIHNGAITGCILQNKKEYRIEGDKLLPQENDKKDQEANPAEADILLQEKKEMEGEQLPAFDEIPPVLMPYNLTVTNGTATVEFLYPFGDTRYNFGLEAKLTITLTKQETLK